MVEGKNPARGQVIGRTSQNKTLNFATTDGPEPRMASTSRAGDAGVSE